MKSLTIIFFALTFCSVLLSAIAQNADSLRIGTMSPLFSLPDQYDEKFVLENGRGQTLILLIGDHHAREELAQWAKEITDQYTQKVRCVFIISFPDVPFFLKGWIKGKFKNNESENKNRQDRVLLDWGGKVFCLYDAIQKNANIILIDDKGFIRGIERGMISPENRQRLFIAIDNLFKTQ